MSGAEHPVGEADRQNGEQARKQPQPGRSPDSENQRGQGDLDPDGDQGGAQVGDERRAEDQDDGGNSTESGPDRPASPAHRPESQADRPLGPATWPVAAPTVDSALSPRDGDGPASGSTTRPADNVIRRSARAISNGSWVARTTPTPASRAATTTPATADHVSRS